MSRIIITAQNIDIYEGDGLDSFARTGDISVAQLERAGASGVLLGHSEVGDGVEVVRKKLLTVLNSNKLVNNTVLVGETWAEFEERTTEEVGESIAQKVRAIFKDISLEHLEKMVVGYEPQWGSRGSGRDDQRPPSSDLVGACAQKIKTTLRELGSQNAPIIYGGRSTPERTEQILAEQVVEGLILGSACNTVQKTLAIAEAMKNAIGTGRKILHANFKAYDLGDSYEKYIEALSQLDDDFVIYLSVPYTDIWFVKKLLYIT